MIMVASRTIVADRVRSAEDLKARVCSGLGPAVVGREV